MSTPRFPSGPWTGFYNYKAGGNTHPMDLHLRFHGGVMEGDGVDDVGPFLIRGHYDEATLEASWVKSYVNLHDVLYHGFREGKGIWGTWNIPPWAHGGFHIWPVVEGGIERQKEAEREVPVEAPLVPATSPAG